MDPPRTTSLRSRRAVRVAAPQSSRRLSSKPTVAFSVSNRRRTPEQAQVLFKVFADTMTNEMDSTKKVIRAIPEDKKGYKPDPKARSAHELAWHIATSEVWFLDFMRP